MLKRTLFFSSPCNLHLKNCQIVVSTMEMPEIQKTIPIEDVGTVILENQQTMITLPLLNALSDNNVSVVICGANYMPNAMLMNLDVNSTQAEKYRSQLEAKEPLKKNLWKQIIEAKIRNQSILLNKIGKDGDKLKPLYMNVKSGDIDNREGVAARVFWNELFGEDFARERDGKSPNNLLNYGYTLLRAAVSRALMGAGLFPAFGIFHRNRYNAFPLADDMMEPYRPFVDSIVYRMYNEGITELTQKAKSDLIGILYTDTKFDDQLRPLEVGLSVSTASLAKCYTGVQKKLVFPVLE